VLGAIEGVQTSNNICQLRHHFTLSKTVKDENSIRASVALSKMDSRLVRVERPEGLRGRRGEAVAALNRKLGLDVVTRTP
jgi:hypothetical protein